MPLVTIPPALLGAGRAGLEAAVAEHAGMPVLLRVDGDWGDAPAPAVAASALTGLPVATVAVGEAPRGLLPVFDLATSDAVEADRWCARFEAAPRAALAAAQLVRLPTDDVWAGLIAESTTYSMLQAGPEFHAWREAHPPSPATDSDAPRVRVDQRGDVTTIVLTRATRHNALDVLLRDQLHEALGDAIPRHGPVVLRADGPSFCSGGDLDEFGTLPDPVTAHLVRLTRSLAWRCHQLSDRLVVGLHGACLGAGIELPAFAAHVVAADDTRVGLPELALGLVPGAGGTVSITRRAGGMRVLQLLLTDGTIPAITAREWRLVDEVVPRAELEARAHDVAKGLR